MSKSSSRMFVCPKCGKEYEIQIWESINVDQDPDLKEKLFHNEIFKMECPHCHDVYQVVYPCLYHNPESKIMVWLVDEKIENEITMNAKIELDQVHGYRYRYCKKIMEFVEKIRILEDGLDDRVVEMGKMFCEKQIIDSKRASQEEISYTIYNQYIDDTVEIVSMVNDEIIRMHLNYKDFEKMFISEEDGYDIDEHEFVRINRKWMFERASKEYAKKSR